MLLLQQKGFDKPIGDHPLQQISNAIEKKVEKVANLVRAARDALADIEEEESTMAESDGLHAYGLNCVQ